MALKLGFEDRGFGRVYVALEAEVPEGGRIVARARTPRMRPVPLMVLRSPRAGSHVLVAPQLPFAYEACIAVESADGKALDHAVYPITPDFRRAADLPTSQRMATGVDDLRLVDARPTADAPWLSVDDLVDFEDGTNVLHGTIVTFLPEGQGEAERRLVVLGDGGEAFEGAHPRVLWEERQALGGGGTVLIQQYSVHIPGDATYVILWLRAGGAQGGARACEGFTVADGDRLWHLRDAWRQTVDSSSNGALYNDWVLFSAKAPDRDLWIQAGTPTEGGPLISIVTPVFETPMEFLREAVESVRAQTYGRWELVLVNASPRNAEVSAYLAEQAAEDGRIKVVTLEENLGITLNTHAGIHAATGDYVAFFDHDDVLEPNALFEYAKAIREEGDLALLYCDEDLLIDGRYYSGFLKPDFDRDLLLNHNYVTHLLCVSRAVIGELEASGKLPGKEFDGAQDYALTLMATRGQRRAWHVRKVLYHWRSHPASTANNASAKTWTDDAGKRAITAYLEEEGIQAKIAPGVQPNMYDVAYELPEDLTLRVVVRRTAKDDRALECLWALAKAVAPHGAEAVVVDPFASLGEEAARRAWPVGDLSVAGCDAGSGVAAQRNLGARGCTAGYLVFVDDVCEVEAPDWLARLLGPLQRGDAMVTGAGLLYEDRLWRSMGICIPKGLPRFENHLVPEFTEKVGYFGLMTRFTHGVSAVSGAAMAVKTPCFMGLGGFDEAFLHAYDDVDLCLRVRRDGGSVAAVPNAKGIYHGRALTGLITPTPYFGYGDELSEERCIEAKADEALFLERWSAYLVKGDPFYNAQFAKGKCHYELKL